MDICNRLDKEENPAGGYVKDVGLDVRWQNGPLGRGSERQAKNGAFVEDLLEASLARLRFYQKSKFSCRENALAITKIEEAVHWLKHRTAEREARGVEGLCEV